jgi:hypothetical protein
VPSSHGEKSTAFTLCLTAGLLAIACKASLTRTISKVEPTFAGNYKKVLWGFSQQSLGLPGLGRQEKIFCNCFQEIRNFIN